MIIDFLNERCHQVYNSRLYHGIITDQLPIIKWSGFTEEYMTWMKKSKTGYIIEKLGYSFKKLFIYF